MHLLFSSRFAILLLSVLFVRDASARLSNYLKDFHTTSDPDTYLDVPQIIKRHGYPIETHVVRTEDGYLLEIHRIPHGTNDTSTSGAKRKPVLLHHGILSCSVDWIINGPHKSLGYKLADLGYDVWIANARGNTYSRAHVSMNPKDEDFWQFSFHEIGTYDLPAVIDHVLATNGADQVRYIGHSMGTTVFYVMCSTRPEYRDKVKLHIGLAPVAFLANTRSVIRYFAPYMERFARMSNWYNKGAFLERDLMTRMTLNLLCTREMFNMNVCERYIPNDVPCTYE